MTTAKDASKYWLMLFVPLLCCHTCRAQPETVCVHVSMAPVTGLEKSVEKRDGSPEAPLRTLEEAQVEIRKRIEAGASGDLEVVIYPGRYELSKTLCLTEKDVPLGGSLMIRASQPNSVNVSGGRIVTGWTEIAKNVWVSERLPDVDQVLPGRQLFIDGQRAGRSREPDDGYFRVAEVGEDGRTSFTVDDDAWSSCSKISTEAARRLELGILHDWSMSRVRVAKLQDKTIHLADRVGAVHDFFRINGFEVHPRFFFENARDFVDTEGEFFWDPEESRFYLYAAKSNPNEWRIVQPTIPTLLTIRGTADKPAGRINIEGLVFSDSTCPLPANGYAGIQASHFERRAADGEPVKADAVHESDRPCPPAAVDVAFAKACVFRNCQFQHLGGGGIYWGEQTTESKLIGCTINDVGANGIMIGETVDRTEPSLVVNSNEVRRCSITKCGQILFGAVGVWVGIARDTRVVGNEVANLPYTGVSVGWRWNNVPSGCRGNLIAENHIHHVMQILSDGGGIYTLGRQPGTRLVKNRIHDVPLNLGRAESNGIFMDEGSSEIVVHDNTIFGTARSPIRFHKCQMNTISSNRLYVAEGVGPFTYNNTDRALVHLRQNEILSGSPGSDVVLPE